MKIGLGIGIPFIRNYISSLFDPSKLFTGSTNGVWYDPSDINLTWRRNLLTYTEQFDNAAWTRSIVSVTANAATAPDGAATADLVYPASSGSGRVVYQNPTLTVGVRYTISFYLKTAGFTWVGVDGTNQTNAAYFDLQNGAVGNVTEGHTATITAVGSGWYRCTVSSTCSIASSYIAARPVDANGSGTATANGTSGIYIWGAQLEQGSTATPYQRITDGIQDYLSYQAQPVLYRDAAGTTPVTGVEQPVGLMLDKSKGLVLGPELVTNGAFDTNVTGWIAMQNATISWSGGRGRATGDGVNAYPGIQQAVTTIIGRTYRVEGNVYAISGGPSTILQASTSFGAGPGQGDVTSTGTYKTFVFTAAATTTYIKAVANSSANAVIECDNISVRELPGNHAFNSSGNSANFPVLSARYNLLTKTEQFDDAVWTKSQTTAPSVSVTNPIGGALANKLTEDTTNATHSVGQYISASAGSCKITVYAKQAGRQRLVFVLQDSSKNNGCYAVINLNTVNVDVDATLFGAGFNNGSASATSVGNGWVLCTLTATVPATTIGLSCQLDNATSGPLSQGYLGNGTDGIYIWGADLRVANDALNQPAYQRVNTATDYDTVGFKPYLRFNGTNQWLQTNSIDFTYGDKMFVSAGVRKLSDAGGQILFELSANVNNGTFSIYAGDNGSASGAYWTFINKGVSSGVNLQKATSTAPVTSVLSVQNQIRSTPRINANLNGSSFGTTVGTADAGNYGNYPLYLGARAGSSLWFNGRMYGMVVAGKLANAVEITETEKYVNSKTAAY